MGKRISTEGQTTICKTLHMKLKIGKHEPQKNSSVLETVYLWSYILSTLISTVSLIFDGLLVGNFLTRRYAFFFYLFCPNRESIQVFFRLV